MDKEWAQQVAKDAAEKMRQGANEAGQRAGLEIQPTLGQGNSMVQGHG